MGDLESGFEEMQGVKLGYLVIKGKQMFALSQVFTDLLKNIPRTTVHKRMDHLNVKKHHCDLEELRKLKAINSIAFHAAKCTLISREDVEALYFSCKTERVLKSNKRKVKAKPSESVRNGQVHNDSPDGFWKEKLWLSLHSVPQTFSFKNKAGRQETASRPDSNLPQIYSKSLRHDFQAVTKSASKTFKNYETTPIPSNYVAFNQRHSFFRNAVSRQPVLYQSAIAAQSKLAGTTDLLYKRKRKRESTGRQFWNRSRPSQQLLFVPKCCKTKIPNGSFHLDHDLYLDHQHTGNFQESCSSDTESSSFSEHVNNDSDFGSSLSTTSNSGTSDEEEDESPSESSEVSSDEESSSQSDSSSVSSQVSIQSIRFRRARFTSLNTKAPLLLQPTFHYSLQPRPGAHSGTTAPNDDKGKKQQKCGFTKCRDNRGDGDALNLPKFNTSVAASYFIDSKGKGVSSTQPQFEFPHDPKTEDLTANGAIKTEAGEPLSATSSSNETRPVKTPTTLLNNVKIKVESTYDEYEYETQGYAYSTKGQESETNNSQDPINELKPTDRSSNFSKASESTATVHRKTRSNQEAESTFNTACPVEGEYKNGARVRKNYRSLALGSQAEAPRIQARVTARVDRSPRPAGKADSNVGSGEGCTGARD
ncbi:SKI/DACH domain-containing protein 1 [Alosa alosa]|uniref:SKI/DACH domain-containing protein 1 n=1 Tax=Alosa alosa TaxID=278164 RepID=UPI0020151043|nr:SKI/DACH domain-containing protein 1 [Alosa alosa]